MTWPPAGWLPLSEVMRVALAREGGRSALEECAETLKRIDKKTETGER